jgi:peptide/nickel transport system permease protein
MKLFKNLLKSPSFIFGASLFLATLLLALLGPVFFHLDTKTRVGLAYMEPSGKAWLGTDHLGLDMFSLLIAGLRSSLYVGFVAGTIATVVGTIVGVYGGYKGGLIDDVLTVLPTCSWSSRA